MLQSLCISLGLFLSALMFQEGSEDSHELRFHQKVSHCFHQIISSPHWKKHVVYFFFDDGVDDSYGVHSNHTEIFDHLEERVILELKAQAEQHGDVIYFHGDECKGDDAGSDADGYDYQQFYFHGVFGVDQFLQPQAVDENGSPYKLMDYFLYVVSDFFRTPKLVIELHKYVEIVVIIVVEYYRNDFQEDDGDNGQGYSGLIFKELIYFGPASRGVYFVSVDQSDAPEDIGEVDASVEAVEERLVELFILIVVAHEEVESVDHRVQENLQSHEGEGQDAEHGRFLFEGEVIFENEPFCAYPH